MKHQPHAKVRAYLIRTLCGWWSLDEKTRQTTRLPRGPCQHIKLPLSLVMAPPHQPPTPLLEATSPKTTMQPRESFGFPCSFLGFPCHEQVQCLSRSPSQSKIGSLPGRSVPDSPPIIVLLPVCNGLLTCHSDPNGRNPGAIPPLACPPRHALLFQCQR